MVSALDSGSSGPVSSPGRGTALCSWARHSTLIRASLQPGVSIPANFLLRVPGDGLASHPGGGGGVEILLVALCYGNRVKLWPDGPLGS